MSDIIARYLFVIVACIALLIGLQVPNFVDQYHKRVDAHLREVSINLKPFQDIANKFFGGDMDKLIALHRDSGEKPFQEEGDAISQLLQRKARFTADLAALETNLPAQAWHVLMNGDREMRNEVIAQYSYAVPLDKDALLFGGGLALMVLVLMDLLLGLARLIFIRGSRSPQAR